MSSLAKSTFPPTWLHARTATVSLAVTSLLFAAGLLIGYQSLQAFAQLATEIPAAEGWNFGTIAVRNLGVACLLYTGAVSGGAATVMTVPLLGLYVGATAKIGVTTAGMLPLVNSVLWYVPFEFFGCLVAAAGGMYPVVAALRRRASSPGPRPGAVTAYLSALPGSLVLFVAGAVLILCGAAIESVVIS